MEKGMKRGLRIIGMWIVTNVVLLLVFAWFVNLLGVPTRSWEAIPATVYILTLVISAFFTFILGAQIDDNMWRDDKY
jgi:protein-S-isoprenylcysteine O-methyltransferase Ste14